MFILVVLEGEAAVGLIASRGLVGSAWGLSRLWSSGEYSGVSLLEDIDVRPGVREK